MAIANTMKTIEKSIGKVNPYYDMYYTNIIDIVENSKDTFDLVSNAFRFGYMQGMKAANSKRTANHKKVGDTV